MKYFIFLLFLPLTSNSQHKLRVFGEFGVASKDFKTVGGNILIGVKPANVFAIGIGAEAYNYSEGDNTISVPVFLDARFILPSRVIHPFVSLNGGYFSYSFTYSSSFNSLYGIKSTEVKGQGFYGVGGGFWLSGKNPNNGITVSAYYRNAAFITKTTDLLLRQYPAGSFNDEFAVVKLGYKF